MRDKRATVSRWYLKLWNWMRSPKVWNINRKEKHFRFRPLGYGNIKRSEKQRTSKRNWEGATAFEVGGKSESMLFWKPSREDIFVYVLLPASSSFFWTPDLNPTTYLTSYKPLEFNIVKTEIFIFLSKFDLPCLSLNLSNYPLSY